uniref:Ig-like domain-containing protein n=1 Tax=Chelonoidis abingdonii TaxID=106734 RepID=A0A8C0IU18_CHEAB
ETQTLVSVPCSPWGLTPTPDLHGPRKPLLNAPPHGVIPMGGNFTIWCWHQLLDMSIQLYKAGDGNYLTYTDPAGSEAEFPITSARRDHGGSYTCRYSNRTDPPAYSEPSDPVQIIVADPSLPRPSISLSLTSVTASGAGATIRCQGQRRDVRFFLHKAGDLNLQRQMDPAGDGAEFLIPTVGRQHGGSYSCSYRPRSEPFVSSQPSDTVQLVVAGESPSLASLGRVAPGAAVTVRCECQCRGARVLLSKAGDSDARRVIDLSGDVAEFPIRSVSQRDAGSYSCQYSTKSNPSVWSEPSNPVELILPAPGPSISVSPSGVIALGAAVTIRCQCWCEARKLLLYKGGIPIQEVYADGDGGEFTIPSARREDSGSYSCQSRSRSEPPNWSDPSEFMRIVVAGERSSLASPLAARPTRTPPEHPDFTHANVARLALGAAVLLVLGPILAEVYYSHPREAS